VVPLQCQDTATTPTAAAAAAATTDSATAAVAAATVQIDWTAVGYAVDGGGNSDSNSDTVLMVSRRQSEKRSKVQRYILTIYVQCMRSVCICQHDNVHVAARLLNAQ
jgi:hypothetical protein